MREQKSILPVEKIIPRKTPNPDIDKALSILKPAMINVGTPLSIPYRRVDRSSMHGTTTDGDTPENMKL